MAVTLSAGPAADQVDAFIDRWQGREGGQERANYQLFLTGLCRLIDVPEPDPADASHERNDYVFERVVTKHRDEGDALGRIDLYRRGSFVLEAKQSRLKGGAKEVAGREDLFKAAEPAEPRGPRGANRSWDVLMLNAKRQAEEYARALPVSHGWPPFILVCDVGHCLEVYSDFSGQGTGPIDAAAIAATFKQGKRVEAKVNAALASLVRLGHIATADRGRTFQMKRVA